VLSESYFYKHLHRDGSTCILDFDRLKGKKSGTNRLAPKTTAALYAYLEEHLILFHEVKDMIALVFLDCWSVVQRNKISFSS